MLKNRSIVCLAGNLPGVIFGFFFSPAVIGCLSAAPPGVGLPFYGDPPDQTHPWSVHDRNRPQPGVVTTGGAVTTSAPSDAVILFDGGDLSAWKLEKPKWGKRWVVRDGCMECVPGSGNIRTKVEFGDCQLHLEWASPEEIKGKGQGRGNSGVFLMGLTEVQVLDSYENPTYPDGMAGAVYGINPPMVNALNPPGEFNSYDIIFRRPVFRDGVEVDPGYFTVFCNGVLIQDHTPLEGGGGHRGRSAPREFPETGPLKLQDHGNPVRYRNIWYRPLPPRAVEGGTSGALTPEATSRLRREIAAGIREDAAELGGGDLAELYRMMESLVYEHDDEALNRVRELSDAYVATLESMSGEDLERQKNSVLEMHRCLDYMRRHERIGRDFPAQGKIDALIARMGWDPGKK